MLNGKLSRAGAIGVLALVSVGLAACGPGATSLAEKPMQGGLKRDSGRLPPAMHPHAVRAQLDSASGRVWVLHVDGVDVHDATGTTGTKTSIQLPGWSWATEPYACPPDLAVVGNRDVLVTSNVSAVIWRIDSATLEVTRYDLAVPENAGREVGFSRLFYSAHDDALFAAGAFDSSLWHIDRSLTHAHPIALSRPLPEGCVLSVARSSTADNTFCLQIEHSDWIVTMYADRRRGDVHPAKCSNDMR